MDLADGRVSWFLIYYNCLCFYCWW